MTLVAPAGFAAIQDSIGGTAVSLEDFGFTTDQIKETDIAQVEVTAGDGLRYYYSGDTPTAAIGHRVPESETRFVVGVRNVRKLLLISEGSTEATITLSKY